MAVISKKGIKVDPLRNFRFIVNIGGNAPNFIGFSKVSGLSLGATDIIEYREGNDSISPRKINGQNKFDIVTLERGLSLDNSLENWRLEVSNSEKQIFGGGPDGNIGATGQFRRTVTILIIHKTLGIPVKGFRLLSAWPSKLSYGDLDASASDINIATLELAVENINVFNLGQNPIDHISAQTPISIF